MKRKTFLLNSAVMLATYPLLNALQACQIKKKRRGPGVFVLIQLIGGNDGLHTLVPLDRYKKLQEARKNIFLPENKILPIKGTSICGLHPSLPGIRDLFDNGVVGFVQGVGYSNPNFSHFRSSDIWLTGSNSSEALYTGWMARYLTGQQSALTFTTQPASPPAIKIGDTGTFAFQGKTADLSIVVNPGEPFAPSGIDANQSSSNSYGNDEVKVIRETLLQSDKYVGVMKKALNCPFQSSALYPKEGENPLADQLKVVARLINAGLETPVYLVDMKGFDTHVQQVSSSDSTKGVHADLLKKVSQAITCFWDDVVHMGRESDVAGMMFSEFGRRIISTSGYGTDHGTSQPLLFFGGDINKQLIGHNPVLPETIVADTNLPLQHDFKAVYSTILKQWFNAPENTINSVLPGNYNELDMFNS